MHRYLAHAVLLAAIGFAASPLLFPGFGGYRADLFPIPQHDPPVQPAGWTFAIWTLIHGWLILGSAYGLWRASDAPDWQGTRPALLASLIIGIFWIPVANRSPGWATAMILAMLGFAVAAFLCAGGRDRPWLLRPLAIYAGWLTAASGASVGILMGGHGILPAQAAAVLSLLGVTALAAAIHAARPEEWGYPVAVIWALAGIFAANLSPPNWLLLLVSATGAALLAFRAFSGAADAKKETAR